MFPEQVGGLCEKEKNHEPSIGHQANQKMQARQFSVRIRDDHVHAVFST